MLRPQPALPSFAAGAKSRDRRMGKVRDKPAFDHRTMKGSSRCKASVAGSPLLASQPVRDLTKWQPVSFIDFKMGSQDFKGQGDFLLPDRSKVCVADIGLTISKRDIGWETTHDR